MIHLQSLVAPHMLASLAATAAVAPHAAIIEVGVYYGGSAQVLDHVAQDCGRPLWLYDTFAGLPWCDPDKGDTMPVEHFADGLTLEECTRLFPRARVQAGVFPHGVELPEAIGFAHLDVDQYRSVREAIDAIAPRLVPDGVILLDDYCLAGCQRAVLETPHKGEAPLRLNMLADGRALLRRRRRS